MSEQNYWSFPDEYPIKCQNSWHTAVTALTDAARGSVPGEVPDFAGFLAGALAAVAGNLGSVDALTAGRPGSWESDLVDRLVRGTVGPDDDPVQLAPYRSLPVIVPLNVAQVVWETYDDASTEHKTSMLMPLEDAIDEVYAASEKWLDSQTGPEQDASAEEHARWGAALDKMTAQNEAQEAALKERYRRTFETYADSFKAAVIEAATAIEGLKTKVQFRPVVDPEATWDNINGEDVTNPDSDHSDRLALHLWTIAHQQVPVPTKLAPSAPKAQ